MIDFNYGIKLSTLNESDKPLIRSWRNCKSINRWSRQSDEISEGHHEKWFAGLAGNVSTKMYGIYHGVGNELVGVCGFTNIDTLSRSAEFSIYIGPENQRAGLGKKSLKTLVSHGFDNLNLHSIWGESFEGNPAMFMFEQLGFKKDGIQRQCYYKEGKYVDAHIYTILESEWN